MTQAHRPRRIVMVLLALSACALFAAHLAAVFTENVNWDEFAMFARVATMLRTKALQGGGRPALAELLLAPFVRGCVDTMATIQSARLLWSGIVLSGVVALFLLMRRARMHRADPVAGAVLAVGLFVLALPFLRWSIQVRTDQPSMALGLWGGVALLCSRERRWLGVLAGVAFGLAYCFTQKLVYVASLCTLLTLADVWVSGPGQLRRELTSLATRFLGCALGASIVAAVYRGALPLVVAIPRAVPVADALATFANYRETFGTSLYRGMLGSAVPHLLLALLLVGATLHALVRRAPVRHLLVSCATLVAGLCVAWVHTAMFPYFWMTLGLFPAIALGYSFEELAALIPVRLRAFASYALIAVLLLPAAVYTGLLLQDSQRVQRDALHFIDRSFPKGSYGYQLEGALFCRVDPDPFPTLFRESIEAKYLGPNAAGNIDALLARFRDKPVSFLVESHMLPFFPEEVRRFWAENYQPYLGPVRIAGRILSGDASRPPLRCPLTISAAYRWLPFVPQAVATLRIDGTPISNGQVIQLERGEHEVTFLARTDGLLVLAVADPPALSDEAFYSFDPIRELIGQGYWPQ